VHTNKATCGKRIDAFEEKNGGEDERGGVEWGLNFSDHSLRCTNEKIEGFHLNTVESCW
jgi:hypothetical protein